MKQKNFISLIILALLLTITSAMAVTISGGSSSYTFDVSNCTATPLTALTCSASTIRYQCDFTNIAFIDHVDYRINGIDYTATQNSTNPNQFYLTYQKSLDLISNNDPLTFDRQTVTDVDNHKLNSNFAIAISHSCDTCSASFTNTPIDYCQIDNTQLFEHISTNQSCQPNYNDTQSCNYCNPQLIANTTTCNQNNNQTTIYQDLNFNQCCAITGLQEDCPTLYYPYNQQNTNTCQYYQEDFACNIDKAPVLNDKINVNCELPEADACCIINLYQNQNGTRVLLQSNPEYKSSSSTIIPTEQETRNCFPTTNRLLNAYYTQKELRPDTQYETEILCTSDTTSYRTVKTITPVYHTIDEPLNRIKWFGDNTGYIFVAIIVGLIIFFIIVFAIKKLRGK